MAIACADHVRALRHRARRSRSLSHSDFGSDDTAVGAQDARGARADRRSARRSSKSTARCRPIPRCRELIRERVLPHSRLKGEANVLIMPNLDAANIAFQFIKVLADALPVGPILIGPAQPGAYPDARR